MKKGRELVSVSVSYGHCKKIATTGWLKTTEISSLVVPEARCLNRVLAGPRSLEGSRGEPFLDSSSSHWLLAFLGLWLHHSNLPLTLHDLFIFPVCLLEDLT